MFWILSTPERNYVGLTFSFPANIACCEPTLMYFERYTSVYEFSTKK